MKKNQIDKLNLPVIKQPVFEPKSLSMDEYLKFVDFNLRYTTDWKASRDWKRKLFVNTHFSF